MHQSSFSYSSEWPKHPLNHNPSLLRDVWSSHHLADSLQSKHLSTVSSTLSVTSLHAPCCLLTSPPFLLLPCEGHPPWNIYYTPAAPGRSGCGPAPSSSLACSAPRGTFAFSVTSLNTPSSLKPSLSSGRMTSPSVALHANHFYSMQPSASMLFYLSHLPHWPVHVLPAGCCLNPHLSLWCLMCSECVINRCCMTSWLSFCLSVFYCWHVLSTLNCKLCEVCNCFWLIFFYLYPLPCSLHRWCLLC